MKKNNSAHYLLRALAAVLLCSVCLAGCAKQPPQASQPQPPKPAAGWKDSVDTPKLSPKAASDGLMTDEEIARAIAQQSGTAGYSVTLAQDGQGEYDARSALYGEVIQLLQPLRKDLAAGKPLPQKLRVKAENLPAFEFLFTLEIAPHAGKDAMPVLAPHLQEISVYGKTYTLRQLFRDNETEEVNLSGYNDEDIVPAPYSFDSARSTSAAKLDAEEGYPDKDSGEYLDIYHHMDVGYGPADRGWSAARRQAEAEAYGDASAADFWRCTNGYIYIYNGCLVLEHGVNSTYVFGPDGFIHLQNTSVYNLQGAPDMEEWAQNGIPLNGSTQVYVQNGQLLYKYRAVNYFYSRSYMGVVCEAGAVTPAGGTLQAVPAAQLTAEQYLRSEYNPYMREYMDGLLQYQSSDWTVLEQHILRWTDMP